MVGHPPRRTVPPTPRQRRRALLAGGAAVIVIGAGLGTFVALHDNSYDGSGHGCVDVTVASSTGGTIMHECGAAARAWCAQEAAHPDRLAAKVDVQCRLAGITVARTASPVRGRAGIRSAAPAPS